MKDTAALAVTDPSQVGEARRLALGFAAELGMGEEEKGRAALIVTEAANNLVNHAGGGEIVFRKLREPQRTGLEILALDRGPGMANPLESLRDGHSTAGTSGTGLGAMQRLACRFQIHSLPGVGTAVLAEVLFPTPPDKRQRSGPESGGISLPMPGEEVCGDAWTALPRSENAILMVADGLGHGMQAAEASQEALRSFRTQAQRSPAEILKAAHESMQRTRGAAVAVAELDAVAGEVRFAGVGNIGAAIIAEETVTHMVSHNGTVGHLMRKVQEFTYPWPAGSLVILYSDGLASQWRLSAGLFAKAPALVAAVLYRDFRRGRDDVTVVAARAETAERDP